jgi:hypothetical protein
MKYLHNFLVAMVCVATVTFVQAEVQAWRERVVAEVRPGAVVARRGLDTDPITLAVLFGQGGGRWSHVGIAVQLVLDGPIYIESAMPGAGTKLEKPEAFFSALSRHPKVMSCSDAGWTRSMLFRSAATSLLGRPFDDQLAIHDDGQKLYCTELVAMVLKSPLG